MQPLRLLSASFVLVVVSGCASRAPHAQMAEFPGEAGALYPTPAAQPRLGGGEPKTQARRGKPPPPGLPDPEPDSEWAYLTGGRTFERLLADQRWPVFSASYRFQDNGRFLDAYEHVSAGDTIAMIRAPAELGGRPLELEFAVQGAVFSVFDPNLEQSLIIIDYVAGTYLAARSGRASAMLRFWHVSGHVGDEFLLEETYDIDTRTPYKFEAIQLLGSYDLPAGFRAYAGPSLLFGVNPSPEEFGTVILHAGLEWRADQKLFGTVRPVAGVDVQMIDGQDFNPDVSIRAGLSFDRARRGPAFQILGEFYTGRDPNGELFSDRVSFAGIGVFINL